jgi:type II secretory pathway pseudopilin PulG
MRKNIWNSSHGSRSQASQPRLKSEAGITMIEMVVAIMLLTIGLLGLAGAIGFAMSVSNKGRSVTNTKMLVVSILEEIETLRNTDELTFGQIANQGQVDNTGATRAFNGFPSTFQPVSINPGPDGIYGTDDDLIDPGPDGQYGTTDDRTNPAWARQGYSRQILITNLGNNPNIKRVQVTLRHQGNTGTAAQTQDLVGVSYLNNDAGSNFLP